MDNVTILNYMGSKKNLVRFIHEKLTPFVTDKDIIFDIFSGTCTVGYSYKKSNTVYANDSEKYSAYISRALLGQPVSDNTLSLIPPLFDKHYEKFYSKNKSGIETEKRYLDKKDGADELIIFYKAYKTVWNDRELNYSDKGLFSSSYASNYFGVNQAAEIDAVRALIEEIENENDKYVLFACLFYAMKECVFAKDGHMAQPLEFDKNKSRLIVQRKKSVFGLFKDKLKDFTRQEFILPNEENVGNKVFNLDFEELLKQEEIKKDVSIIYADPPYTDMQYSRYYHLLNTVIENKLATPTTSNGVFTKGLYLENRFQSKLSQRSSCLAQMEKLISFSSKYNKTLVISFGYPQNTETQKTDRYVMDVNDLIDKCREYFGNDGVLTETIPYEHSNNRNSETKKVIEYLIICRKPRSPQTKTEAVKERLKAVTPSKNNPLYNSHIYWSQKPYNVCDILLEAFSEKGDTVFDPFLGSGVTLLEAVKKQYGRNAIGYEINEAPLHIVKTLLKNYSLSEYEKDSLKIISELERLNSYYTTICPKCGKEGIISSVRFDLPQRNAVPKLKIIKLNCPQCKKTEKSPSAEDEQLFVRKYTVKNINNELLHENTKLAVYKNERISDIFTPRNFKVVDEILSIINQHGQFNEVYRYILMSVLHLCKITDTHSNSQWPLWIPKKNCVEKNAVSLLCNRIKKFKETIKYLNENYNEQKKYKLFNKGSQFISDEDIPDGSVNLIITDPPYLGQVAYSEYMQLYKPFLGLDFNLDDEIIVTTTPERKKTERDYFASLNKVFGICDKKTVNGGYLCMYFHDNNLKVWSKLIKIMSDNNFRYITQIHVNKQNTLKNIINPKKSLSGDAILIFIKDKPVTYNLPTNESVDEIEANIVQHAKMTIQQSGPQSTPELYDGGLIEYLIYNDWLDKISKKYKTLVDVFEKYFIWNNKTNKWELPET